VRGGLRLYVTTAKGKSQEDFPPFVEIFFLTFSFPYRILNMK